MPSVVDPNAPAVIPSTPSALLPAAANQGMISSLSGISPITPLPTATQVTQNAQQAFLKRTNTATFSAVQQKLNLALAQTQQQNFSSLNIYGVNRLPWIFSTYSSILGLANNATAQGVLGGTTAPTPTNVVASENVGTGPGTIVWIANPKSVTWQVNQRGSESKNKSGTVLHIWHDRFRRTDYDDPKLTFTFQTGNILPQSSDATNPSIPLDHNNQVPGGLNNFYQFLALVDQPKIASNGTANTIHILYQSRIFPAIVLTGFFDPQVVVQFTDDSQNPNQVSGWTASFTVYSTTPKIYDLAGLQSQFMAEGFNSPFSTPGNGANWNGTGGPTLQIPQQAKT